MLGQSGETVKTAPKDGGLIKDTTTATFRNDVIAESARQPVLVDFWGPSAAPCGSRARGLINESKRGSPVFLRRKMSH